MNKRVEEIEGIGPVYAARLKEAGVLHTGQLLERGGTARSREELSGLCGISTDLILKWVNMSDLFRIKGVAGQYAELLEAAGVDTVRELRNRNPQNLADRLREVNREKRKVRQVPGLKSVEAWVEQARQMKPAVHY